MAYEYGVPTGLKNVYFAPLVQDDETGAAYGKPIKIGDSITVKPSFEFSDGRLEADNKVIREDGELMGINYQINTTRLSLEVQAKILGHKLDVNGGILIEDGDTALEGALLYQVTMDNGKNKYVVVYKGVFRDFVEDAQTKRKGSKDYSTPTIEYRGYRRIDGKLRYEVSEEIPGYNQAVVEQWFTEVQEPAKPVVFGGTE